MNDEIEDRKDQRVLSTNAARAHLTLCRNVTTNGRLFSALIVAANLVALNAGGNPMHGKLAVLAALPVGFAAVVDQLPAGHVRTVASIATYGLAAAVAVQTLLMIGSV